MSLPLQRGPKRQNIKIMYAQSWLHKVSHGSHDQKKGEKNEILSKWLLKYISCIYI